MSGGVYVGVLLDNAREAVMQGLRIGVDPEAIVVSPEGLAAIEAVKAAESRRGVPLTVLGKAVRADGGLHGEEVSTRL